jgi:hypothetical protein
MQVQCRCGGNGRDYCPDVVSLRGGKLRSLVQTVQYRSLGWHSHRAPYAAIVLAGGYEEAGDQGRFRAKVGDVLFHERFESHKNTFFSPSTIILNLPLPADRCTAGIAHLEDLDSVVHMAQESKTLHATEGHVVSATSLIIPFFDMLAFSTSFGLAMRWRRRPEYHRRLMLIATCAITSAAFARFPSWLIPDNCFYLGVDGLILVAIAWEWIATHRIHPVYRFGLPALVIGQAVTMYISS